MKPKDTFFRNLSSNRKRAWTAGWILGSVLYFFSVASHAQSYEGKWNRTNLQFSVTVQSWGEQCGVMPRSYSSRKVKPTEILQNNGHLFFSTGGLRTDRCNSPNQALVTLATSRSAHMWTRTCETPKGASKFERIDYTFDGSDDTLKYEATSSFQWTSESDHCSVSWVEKRTYQRADAAETAAPESGGGASPILRVHEDASLGDDGSSRKGGASCEPTGKIKRLILVPQDATIRPTEKLCFQVRGVDSSGCRFAVAPTWSVTQNGVPQNHLIDSRGCFTAGDNAAESDGVFQIDARFKGVATTTAVEISYPDVGDLARARLDLAGEIGEEPSVDEIAMVAAPQGEMVAADGAVQTDQRVSDETDKGPLLVILLVVAVVVLIALLVSMVWLLRKQAGRSPEDDEGFASSPGLSTRSFTGSVRATEKMCPKCNARFSMDAKFCPSDATELEVVAQILRSSTPPPKGMVCPTCKRGYDMDSKFCPHDSTPLVEYEKWRRR